MRSRIFAAACLAAVAAIALDAGGTVSAATLKACNAEWNAMKTAKTTAGKKYADFRKECLAKPDTAATTTPAAAPAADAKPEKKKSSKSKADTASTTTAAKPTGGRQAMYARERACGAEWKADKAAGKIAKGQTWPKYWSECNTRKKAAGM